MSKEMRGLTNSMKTKVLSVIALMLCTLLQAQDNKATLAQIEKANEAITTIEGKFSQTKTLSANGKEIKSEGTIYVSNGDKMAMHYDAPSTDQLIINGDQFFMVRGKKKNHFNTEKNKAMRSLRNTLFYCIHGTPALLAEENNADIQVSKGNTGIVVTLTSQKKTPRGYERIVLTYDSKTCLLNRMEMVEWGGNATLYEMKGLKTNATIATNVFDIPKKSSKDEAEGE